MTPIIVGLIFPLILFFSLYWVVDQSNYSKNWSNIEKLVFSMALSSSLFVAIFSIFSIFPKVDINAVIITCTAIGAISTYKSIKLLTSRRIIEFNHLSKTQKIASIVALILVVKVVILYLVHPIIDPDIINTYLPYARSIVIANHAPPKDFFTANPMTIPPVGGPILFSAIYILSNTIYTENFQLLTAPALLGMLFLTYLFARNYFSRLTSIISIIVMLSMPLIDGMLLNWSLYPDLIYAFIGLTTLYFLEHKYFKLPKNYQQSVSALIGIMLGACILLKNQGILFIYIAVLVILLKLSTSIKIMLPMLLLIVVAPFISVLKPITGITSFGYEPPSLIMTIAYAAISVLLAILASRKTSKNIGNYQDIANLIPMLIASIGLAWMFRNINLYGNITTPTLIDYHQSYYIQRLIDDPVITKNYDDTLSLLLSPSFGVAYLVPKVIGITLALYSAKLLIPIFWVIHAYLLTIIFFGQANPRYLLIIIPIISVLTAYGILVFTKKTSRAVIGVILLAAVSMLQSDFISWNFGPAFSYMTQDKSLLLTHSSEISNAINSSEQTLKYYLQNIHYWINQLSGHTDNKKFYSLMLLLGTVSGVIVHIVSRYESINISIKKAIIVSLLLLIFPYLFIIFRISHFKPWQFAVKEKMMLFGNSGEVEYISPYLKFNTSPDSKILVLGPITSTAYNTSLVTWNVYYHLGMKELLDVLGSEENDTLEFFEKHRITHVLVSQDTISLNKLDILNSNTKLVSFILNTQYFHEVQGVVSQKNWRIYELNNTSH